MGSSSRSYFDKVVGATCNTATTSRPDSEIKLNHVCNFKKGNIVDEKENFLYACRAPLDFKLTNKGVL